MRNALFASLFLVACAPPSSDLEGSQAAIVNGSSDPGDPAVGILHGEGKNAATTYSVCTGAFIAPNVMLTAAHCFNDSSLTWYTGTNASYTDETHDGMQKIASVTINPAYDPTTPAPHPHDQAIVHVSTASKSTLPFHAGAPEPSWIGALVHIVGYGKTSASSHPANERRAVDTAFSSMTATTLVITNGKQPCGGDSGGPALMTLGGIQTIVGTAESASSDCTSQGVYDRLDGDIEFIDTALNDTGSTGSGSTGGTTGGTQTGGCNVGGSGTPRLFGALAILIALVLRRRVA